MAKKISQLTQATEVKSDDVTVIVQDGETKKLPLNMMVTKQDIENKKIAGLAKLDEIEATYENDTYTPTITVKNKSSVKTGEGDEVDYSANVMDGHVKSAILKGNTLNNLTTGFGNNEEVIFNRSWQEISFRNDIIRNNLKNNDLIYMSFEINVHEINIPNNVLKIETARGTGGHSFIVMNSSGIENLPKNNWVRISCIRKVQEDITLDQYKFGITVFGNHPTSNGEQIAKISVRNAIWLNLTETFGSGSEPDKETCDSIPYFDGMQSVKMPVLTTIGSNLAKESYVLNPFYPNLGMTHLSEIVDCISPGTTFYIKGYNIPIATHFMIVEYDGNSRLKDSWVSVSKNQTFRYTVVNKNCNLIKIVHDMNCIEKYGEDIFYTVKMMVSLNENLPTMNYEPYKSNILTVNEDVTLRSNGSVYDELDLLTGKLTQRIDEDGSVLTQEVVKTVDLMPSGTHPSTTPYCWKNGHIQLSSSGLLPNLEYSVVTSRAGQINQNATMIVKNDKRIFDLEILLAGGLVNTTYQALTLQNQVETGLSKVSLSSETEPDYLLYHMIMKLIEEKAYKLDDLTEKVSVFYLYEKLSDEQFETIYSALYPFVEDEIVEEPVVEELPEVVEDEVIM